MFFTWFSYYFFYAFIVSRSWFLNFCFVSSFWLFFCLNNRKEIETKKYLRSLIIIYIFSFHACDELQSCVVNCDISRYNILAIIYDTQIKWIKKSSAKIENHVSRKYCCLFYLIFYIHKHIVHFHYDDLQLLHKKKYPLALLFFISNIYSFLLYIS